jgi:hypothetical protein
MIEMGSSTLKNFAAADVQRPRRLHKPEGNGGADKQIIGTFYFNISVL